MQTEYIQIKKTQNLPRLPLRGSIDLTYRCNNNCRHCWLWTEDSVAERARELSFDEIRGIVDEAKNMGCHQWSISGGEPMLRPDFVEIFDYITGNSASYSVNTNGTLITLQIAQVMKRKGVKMVALYGATAEVHDHITRNPGSFEATMRGFSYLKEAGAGFIVQIIPMKDNYHQFNDMVELAKSLGKHYRVGAAWLYLSSSGDVKRNEEITRQRLSPKDVIELDKPDLSYEERAAEETGGSCCQTNGANGLLASCISARRDFHVDPYGKMSFCCFVKDPGLRYDLRDGNFKEAWENFIPSLESKVEVTKEYEENCGSCESRKGCRWCPVYGYLEHRSFNAKVGYLCGVAKENKQFKDNWKRGHRRYFKIADITIQVESDLPFNDSTLQPKFKFFEVEGPTDDMVTIRHHFSLPDFDERDIGKEVYRKPPWAIYQKGDSWIYQGILPEQNDKSLHRIAIFNNGHTSARIYNDREDGFIKGNLHSLTLFPSDQILLARILADRQGCYLHSCGAILDGKGLLFAGHSEAGKSTMATMLKGRAEILCDDRVIVRKTHRGFKIYGTWSHGDVPDVSAGSAPLRAILFLEKSEENKAVLLIDKKEITKRLLACLIKPFVTNDWWDKTLILVENVVAKVPCYALKFDKSGEVVEVLKKI